MKTDLYNVVDFDCAKARLAKSENVSKVYERRAKYLLIVKFKEEHWADRAIQIIQSNNTKTLARVNILNLSPAAVAKDEQFEQYF